MFIISHPVDRPVHARHLWGIPYHIPSASKNRTNPFSSPPHSCSIFHYNHLSGGLDDESNNTSHSSDGKTTDGVSASTASNWDVGSGRLGRNTTGADDGKGVGVGGSVGGSASWGLVGSDGGGLGGLGAAGVENGGGWDDWLDDGARAVGDGDGGVLGGVSVWFSILEERAREMHDSETHLRKGVGVGLSVVGDGSTGRADSGIDIDDLRGVNNGIVVVGGNRRRGQSQKKH